MISPLSIQKLLSESEYRIPIYQRNYAWGTQEVTQLIQDIADYAFEQKNENYYVGTLVVFPHMDENYFETIDGQQRCTTITIIACALVHNCKDVMSWYKSINVSFDYREKSNETLLSIYQQPHPQIDSDKINVEILTIYRNVWYIIERECKNRALPIRDFVEYFLSKVIILRVSVPVDTDLNHYFEIMNSRGEQLEQHEIVKALLMSSLKENDNNMRMFNIIWEACSNMNRYVQMNLSKNIRDHFFYDDGSIRDVFFSDDIDKVFDDLSDNFATTEEFRKAEDEKSLMDLFMDDLKNVQYEKPWLEYERDKGKAKSKGSPENFGTIISFPNFLLHVLKVLDCKNVKIVLDDKKLMPIFKGCYESLPDEDKCVFVKRFIMNLLKIRYLFDKYVIKRKSEKWTLQQLQKGNNSDSMYYCGTFSKPENDEDGNEKDIIMLQAMFHVSLPSQIYKHWLNAVLLYVYQKNGKNCEISCSDFSNYLWLLAKSYMLDRYLAPDNAVCSFENIIYDNNAIPQNSVNTIDWTKINVDGFKIVGEKIENFVFNFYDYILWKEKKDVSFEFTYRTSVEHFYPQHPIDQKTMDPKHLHSFGNLCLVSNKTNSKFSNSMPAAKYSNFGTDIDLLKSYSLKLQTMMQSMRNNDMWDENKIISEAQKAKELMESYLR